MDQHSNTQHSSNLSSNGAEIIDRVPGPPQTGHHEDQRVTTDAHNEPSDAPEYCLKSTKSAIERDFSSDQLGKSNVVTDNTGNSASAVDLPKPSGDRGGLISETDSFVDAGYEPPRPLDMFTPLHKAFADIAAENSTKMPEQDVVSSENITKKLSSAQLSAANATVEWLDKEIKCKFCTRHLTFSPAGHSLFYK